jgi:hypothetical protein
VTAFRKTVLFAKSLKACAPLAWALILAGCSAKIPDVSSADFAQIVDHVTVGGIDRPQEWTLSSAQIALLAAWLSAHSTGWTTKFEDTAPGVEIYLRRSRVNFAYVNIHPEFVQIGDAYRDLSSDERARLEAIIKNESG